MVSKVIIEQRIARLLKYVVTLRTKASAITTFWFYEGRLEKVKKALLFHKLHSHWAKWPKIWHEDHHLKSHFAIQLLLSQCCELCLKFLRFVTFRDEGSMKRKKVLWISLEFQQRICNNFLHFPWSHWIVTLVQKISQCTTAAIQSYQSYLCQKKQFQKTEEKTRRSYFWKNSTLHEMIKLNHRLMMSRLNGF